MADLARAQDHALKKRRNNPRNRGLGRGAERSPARSEARGAVRQRGLRAPGEDEFRPGAHTTVATGGVIDDEAGLLHVQRQLRRGGWRRQQAREQGDAQLDEAGLKLVLAGIAALVLVTALIERRTWVRGVVVDFDGHCIRRFSGNHLSEIYLQDLRVVGFAGRGDRSLQLADVHGTKLDLPTKALPAALVDALRQLPGVDVARFDSGLRSDGDLGIVWQKGFAR